MLYPIEQWKAFTRAGSAFGSRSDELLRMDGALEGYDRDPTAANLHYVDECLKWLEFRARPGPEHRPSSDGHRHAIVQLRKRVAAEATRLQREKAEIWPILERAANAIRRRFEADMDGTYAAALVRTFTSGSKHVYCYKYYDPADWREYITSTFDVHGPGVADVKGVTPTLGGHHAVSANLPPAGRQPPFNRQICFHEHSKSLHNVLHEMLHWCCHENFRTAELLPGVERTSFEYVREALTEFLARSALAPEQLDVPGGYANYMRSIGTIIESDVYRPMNLERVKRAYFKGDDVAGTVQAIVEAKRAYDLELAETVALKPERLRLLALSRTPRRSDPAKASEELLASMKRAFGNSTDSDEFRQLSAAWQRKVKEG